MGTPEQNAEVVRRGYEGFNTGDMELLTEVFHETVSWHTPGQSYLGGDYQGREATFGQFGRFVGDTGGSFKALLQEVARSDDGRIVSIHGNTAERNGKQLDVMCCIVFEVEDGQIIDGREHFFDLYAWDEFWS